MMDIYDDDDEVNNPIEKVIGCGGFLFIILLVATIIGLFWYVLS